jgi:tRNA (guanine10-N2)-dimethyltransferase
MCHKICSHLCTSDATKEEILEAVASTDLLDLLPHPKTFAVKVKRVKRSAMHLDTMGLARDLAKVVIEEVEFKVDLQHPEVELFCVLSGGKCAVGITKGEIDRNQFRERRPTKRPVFHPSTLPPTLARCMVNLARTPRGGTFLDPFSGVGGILLEAGLIGAKVIGIDIDREMADGARRNLEAYGIRDFQLIVGDARKLPALEVDAIATDPPYGRQATTGGSELRELYREALPSMVWVLKSKGYLCITSPAELELEEMADDAGFRIIEHHGQRVHKSLTRRIYVFRKK